MEINQLMKQYQNKKVISDVNLIIPPKQLTTFIGPNGAGKSTLLSIMSRFIHQDEGQVILDGEDIKKWQSKDLAKKISMLRQTNAIQLKITVKELVAFGRFPYSQGRLTKEDQLYIEEVMAYLGLEDLKTAYIDTLSGGQLQRAYIAMVLAQNTDYLFLDEPLNNLDMNYAVQLMKTMRHLVDAYGKTIVIVLHDINFAASYADYVVAMKQGSIFAQGQMEEIIQKDVLDSLYQMNIRICEIDGKRFCLYFNE